MGSGEPRPGNWNCDGGGRDGSLHWDLRRLTSLGIGMAHFIGIWDLAIGGDLAHTTQKETGGTTLPPVNLLPKTGKTNRRNAV